MLSGLKTGKPPSWPILLGTQKIFPNLWLVCLPLKKESWSADIYKCWENMSKPSLRVFIPLSYNEEPLNKLWTKTPVYDLSFYKEVLK